MRLPKYSNPHLAVDTTRIVSRETLQLQGDTCDDVGRDGEADDAELDRLEAESLHVKLEEIVSKRLKLKRALTPSGESRSKKRSRMLVEEGEGELVEPQRASEPVGEFKFSYSSRANRQPLSKLSVLCQARYRPAPSI